MVLTGMYLFENPAHARLVASHHDEQISHDKTHRYQLVDHLNMR